MCNAPCPGCRYPDPRRGKGCTRCVPKYATLAELDTAIGDGDVDFDDGMHAVIDNDEITIWAGEDRLYYNGPQETLIEALLVMGVDSEMA